MTGDPLVVSVSGGATSAFLALVCATWPPYATREKRYVFANTGAEHPETLDFLRRIDEQWGLGIVWVEARYASDGAHTHAVVNHETAARDGAPFAAMCSRYGIPSHGHGRMTCTRELKVRTIRSYLRSIGLRRNTYDTAIGIRVDEIDRMSINAKRDRIVYPLVEQRVTRESIEEFWAKKEWRLAIPNYLGNCVTCFKKSDRKLFQIAREAPEAFNLFRRLEEQHAHAGAAARAGKRVRFFRGHRTVDELLADARRGVSDDLEAGACAETCEGFGET